MVTLGLSVGQGAEEQKGKSNVPLEQIVKSQCEVARTLSVLRSDR